MEILKRETNGDEIVLTVTAPGIVGAEAQTAAAFAAQYGRPVRLEVRYVNGRDTFHAEPPAGSHRTPQQTELGTVQGSTVQFGIKSQPPRLTFSLCCQLDDQLRARLIQELKNGGTLTLSGDILPDELVAILKSIDIGNLGELTAPTPAGPRPAGLVDTAVIGGGVLL